MELNYWSSTVCKNAEYDEAKAEWTVRVERDGKEVALKPKQLVMATGMSAVPMVPEFPGMDSFKGDIHHSSKHSGGDKYAGKKADVGASELIANGDIKLKTGQAERITENSVVLADGTEIEADLIVLATGYSSMNGWLAQLISQEMADKVGKVWGMGSDTTKDPGPWEGELRNMWKPTQQPGLWFHGGNLHQSRHYSSYLSLQLKARMENISTPIYGLQDVHHIS